MTDLSHTRCYQCGKVILIAEASRRDVTVGSSSFFCGHIGGSRDGGNILGGGSQWQRVDFCRSCEQKARDRDRWISFCIYATIVLLIALIAAVILIFGVILRKQRQLPVTQEFHETEPSPNVIQQLDGKSKEKADPIQRNRVTEEEKAAAKAKAEAEAREAQRCEAEMVRYELAKIRYHAAGRLNVARRLAFDAESEKAKGNDREAERLLRRAKERSQDLIDRYPHTDEASDARLILDGKTAPPRLPPPAPVLPEGVKANEDELAGKPVPLQGPNLPAGPARAIFVRGYTIQIVPTWLLTT